MPEKERNSFFKKQENLLTADKTFKIKKEKRKSTSMKSMKHMQEGGQLYHIITWGIWRFNEVWLNGWVMTRRQAPFGEPFLCSNSCSHFCSFIKKKKVKMKTWRSSSISSRLISGKMYGSFHAIIRGFLSLRMYMQRVRDEDGSQLPCFATTRREWLLLEHCVGETNTDDSPGCCKSWSSWAML